MTFDQLMVDMSHNADDNVWVVCSTTRDHAVFVTLLDGTDPMTPLGVHEVEHEQPVNLQDIGRMLITDDWMPDLWDIPTAARLLGSTPVAIVQYLHPEEA